MKQKLFVVFSLVVFNDFYCSNKEDKKRSIFWGMFSKEKKNNNENTIKEVVNNTDLKVENYCYDQNIENLFEVGKRIIMNNNGKLNSGEIIASKNLKLSSDRKVSGFLFVRYDDNTEDWIDVSCIND